jgi:glycosyltransferase involved in cell wall biosynthesis
MKLALFFTLGMSLKKWEQVGMFDREIKPYKKLAGAFYERTYFITYGGDDDLGYSEVLGQNIIVLPKKYSWMPDKMYSFFIPFAYSKELKNCDILKTNQMAGSWAAVLAKWMYGKKLLLRAGYQWSINAKGWGAGAIKNRIIYLAELVAYRYADAISVTSDEASAYIEKRYKIDAAKIDLVSNYVDTDLFRPIEEQKIKNSVCFVGRLEKEKNLFALFEAIKDTGLNLVLFGSGKFEKELKDLAQKLSIKVDFRGNVRNDLLPQELNKCEIFILPSLYEGNPKVMLEAMSCALPVIGTKVQGIANILVHKKNGYLCDVSASSLKEALMDLAGDKDLQKKIGDEARQYVLENCSLEKILEKEKKIIQKMS